MRLLALYLTAPLVLFFAAWFKPIIGLPLAALTVGFLAFACFKLTSGWPSPRALVFYALFAAFLALTSGISPLVNGGGELDLAKHRYVFNDLVSHDWPVLIGSELLRYGLGFYLVPAGIAKLAPAFGPTILVMWLALGLFLTFSALDRVVGGGRLAIVAAVCFAFFSGLDVLYFWIHFPHELLTFHDKDAWSAEAGMLIGSNPFNLSWTPQHALAAWMAAILIYGQRREWVVSNAALIVTAVAFWSPFCAVAVVTLLIPLAVMNWRAALSLSNLVLGVTISIVTLLYLSLDGGRLPIYIERPTAFFLAMYAWVVVLEFGVLSTILILSGYRSYWLFASVALLLVLPFLVIGSHDLQMRASIVPMTILFVIAFEVLRSGPTLAKSATTVVIAIGLWAGLNSFVWILTSTPAQPQGQSITALPQPFWPQYLATPSPLMRAIIF